MRGVKVTHILIFSHFQIINSARSFIKMVIKLVKVSSLGVYASASRTDARNRALILYEIVLWYTQYYLYKKY